MADFGNQPHESIPVCTLFNEVGSSDGGDVFGDVAEDNLRKTEPVREERRKSSEPKLCNVFAEGVTSDPTDDIFSNITEEKFPEITQNEEITLPDAIGTSEDISNSNTPETISMHNSRSVDSFIVEDLAESDVAADVASVEQPAPSSGAADLAATPSDVSQSGKVDDEILKDPIIASPSFISVTSFSISPDGDSSLNLTNLDTSSKEDSVSNLTSDIEGLTIESVAANMSQLDVTPTPGGAIYNEEVTSSDSQDNTTTESLFTQESHIQHAGLFSNDNAAGTDEGMHMDWNLPNYFSYCQTTNPWLFTMYRVRSHDCIRYLMN